MADEQDLFERVWYAERDGRIDLGFELKLLNKPGSPVFSIADIMLPWVATLCLAVVGWRLGGWVGAGVAIASMIILIATTINFAVMRRLRRRALDYALSGRRGFDDLWRMGALSVRLKDQPASEIRGPEGDWRGFASSRLPKTRAERGR